MALENLPIVVTMAQNQLVAPLLVGNERKIVTASRAFMGIEAQLMARKSLSVGNALLFVGISLLLMAINRAFVGTGLLLMAKNALIVETGLHLMAKRSLSVGNASRSVETSLISVGIVRCLAAIGRPSVATAAHPGPMAALRPGPRRSLCLPTVCLPAAWRWQLSAR